jgi:translation initiation factor 3 subunit F
VGRWSQNEGAADGEGVKDGLQDTLTVSFLANLVRSQVELAGRLQLLPQAQQQQ